MVGVISGAASPYSPSVVRNLVSPATVRSPLYSAVEPSGLGARTGREERGVEAGPVQLNGGEGVDAGLARHLVDGGVDLGHEVRGELGPQLVPDCRSQWVW